MCSTRYCGFRSSALAVSSKPLHRQPAVAIVTISNRRSYAGFQMTHAILSPFGGAVIVKVLPLPFVDLFVRHGRSRFWLFLEVRILRCSLASDFVPACGLSSAAPVAVVVALVLGADPCSGLGAF